MDFVLVSAISIADSIGSSPKICAGQCSEELVDPRHSHEQPRSQIHRDPQGLFRVGRICICQSVSAKNMCFFPQKQMKARKCIVSVVRPTISHPASRPAGRPVGQKPKSAFPPAGRPPKNQAQPEASKNSHGLQVPA